MTFQRTEGVTGIYQGVISESTVDFTMEEREPISQLQLLLAVEDEYR